MTPENVVGGEMTKVRRRFPSISSITEDLIMSGRTEHDVGISLVLFIFNNISFLFDFENICYEIVPCLLKSHQMSIYNKEVTNE